MNVLISILPPSAAPGPVRRTRSGRIAMVPPPDRRPRRRQPDALRDKCAVAPLAFEQIDLADEVGNEARARAIVDLARRADLLDPAGVHHGDAVRHRHRLLLIVGHEDRRDAELLLQLLAARPACSAAACGRARRAARRTAARAAGSRSRARARRAAAARRRAAPGGGPRSLSSATWRSAWSTRVSISSLPSPRMRSPNATFSATVRCGNSA